MLTLKDSMSIMKDSFHFQIGELLFFIQCNIILFEVRNYCMKRLYKNSSSKCHISLTGDILLRISSSRKINISGIIELLEYTEYTLLDNLALKSHTTDYYLEHSDTKKIPTYSKNSIQEQVVEFITCSSDSNPKELIDSVSYSTLKGS